jgi:hypothetical protein
MVIVNDGLKNIRKFLANSGGNPPSSIMLGEDGSAVSENDVWLGSPVASTEKGFSVTPVEGDFTVQYEHTLNSLEGNGYNFKEFILLDSTNNSAYSHDLFTNVNKTTAFEMQTTITIKVLNEE